MLNQITFPLKIRVRFAYNATRPRIKSIQPRAIHFYAKPSQKTRLSSLAKMKSEKMPPTLGLVVVAPAAPYTCKLIHQPPPSPMSSDFKANVVSPLPTANEPNPSRAGLYRAIDIPSLSDGEQLAAEAAPLSSAEKNVNGTPPRPYCCALRVIMIASNVARFLMKTARMKRALRSLSLSLSPSFILSLLLLRASRFFQLRRFFCTLSLVRRKRFFLIPEILRSAVLVFSLLLLLSAPSFGVFASTCRLRRSRGNVVVYNVRSRDCAE